MKKYCPILWCVLIAFMLVLNGSFAAAQKPIDLNTASEKELESLKGVGPATAKKIVSNRPYKSVDELSKAGLSAKQIEALRPLVTIGSAAPAPAAPAATGKSVGATPPPAKPAQEAKPAKETKPAKEAKPAKTSKAVAKLAPGQKVNINTASKEELEALPGIGPVKAQAIIDGRPYQKPEDIKKVKGIKEGEFKKIKDIIIVK